MKVNVLRVAKTLREHGDSLIDLENLWQPLTDPADAWETVQHLGQIVAQVKVIVAGLRDGGRHLANQYVSIEPQSLEDAEDSQRALEEYVDFVNDELTDAQDRIADLRYVFPEPTATHS